MTGIIWMESKINEKILTPSQIAEFRDVSAKVNNKATKEVAVWMQKTMQKWIDKDGTYKIGASGKAASNIQVESDGSQASSGIWRWTVTEGNATEANQYIREGMRAGTIVTISRLRMWAAQKGVELTQRDGENSGLKGGFIKVNRKSGSYAQAKRNTRQVTIAALYKIKRALFKEGTFRETSSWSQRSPYPSTLNAGRFDYPAYLVQKRRDHIERQIDKAGVKATETLVEYLAGSGKIGGTIIT